MAKVLLDPIRCCRCGRFLGYQVAENALVLIRCHNCDGFTVIAEGLLGKFDSEEIRGVLTKHPKGSILLTRTKG
jgi:hypothetical protein